MYRLQLAFPLSVLVLAPLAAGACGGGDNPSNPDGGADAASACTTTTTSGMGILQDFCSPEDPGGNGILVTASGEDLALSGYAFPPATPDDFALVDGWEIHFDRVLSTFDHVTLSDDPDKSPTDQSQTGAVVAEVDGPFAVDLHKGGPLIGKGGGDERAVAVGALTGQNKHGGAAFDPTVRYAFGFEIVKATTSAKNINLDAADLTDYQEMIQKGYTTLLVGTATFKGTACTSTIAGYDFTKIPTTIKFRFGYAAPTTYINAQNPDNDPAAAFPNEEHQRRPPHRAEPVDGRADDVPHRPHLVGELRARLAGALRRVRVEVRGRNHDAHGGPRGLQGLCVQAVRRWPRTAAAVADLPRRLHAADDRRDDVRHARRPGQSDGQPWHVDPRLLRLRPVQP